MDLQQAQRRLTADLTPLYGHREAASIADWVMEHLTGRRKLDRLTHSGPLTDAQLNLYDRYRGELLDNRPVQYVLHESWFAGMKFYVDESVLIPRPETEELVEWVIETVKAASPTPPAPLLDVGTGSGCIPIAIAKQLPSLPVHACDISSTALRVAQRNAASLGTHVHFHHLDFLDRRTWSTLPPIQWLVSNPPYIPEAERSTLAPHVAGAEPALALFIPDSDPLIFYRALAEFAQQRLTPDGSIFVEMHEDLASGVLDLFRSAGFERLTLRKDMQARDRMISATRLPAMPPAQHP